MSEAWGAALSPRHWALTRSKARTVPSRLALTTPWPLGRKAAAVTGAACSANVTKQNPLLSVHTLTW